MTDPARLTRPRLIAAVVTAAVIIAISRDDLAATWWWSWPLIAAVAVAVAVAIPIAQSALAPGVAPGLVVGAAAASFACVPETDQFPSIAVVAVSLALVELRRGRHLRFGWVYGVAAVVMWAGFYGATGRASALVGTAFSWFPMLVAAGLAPWLRRARPPQLVTGSLALAPTAVATAVVARTGALEPTITPALVDVAVAAPISLAITAAIAAALGLLARG